ncbi:uncharacterized protein MELLADRAFT_39211, partial [Melampsora larici-populina 98AG31]
GVKYTCDGCSADISHSVKIRCAHQQQTQTNTISGQNQVTSTLVCENFDLCAQCFCEGKEVGRHKAWHDYRVVEQYSTPIFTEDWGADEELLLIEACQTYGLGNWADIADHVGNGRTKEEVEKHYIEVFIDCDDYPLPMINNLRDCQLMDARINIDQDEFQARKKQRLEEETPGERVDTYAIEPPPPKPLASGPSNHEIAGFMPGRLDFETEWENDAENSIKDLSFGREEAAPPIHDENDDDLELKLTILDIYNERYDKRLEAKAVVFDRNLLETKKIQATEKKMARDVRDLVTRIKPFARLQTALDHERFQEGLIYEMSLRKRIAELQEYRRMGITTLAEAERFDKEKQSRVCSPYPTFQRSLITKYVNHGRPSLQISNKIREFGGVERSNGRTKNRASGSAPFYDELASGSREGTPGFTSKTYKKLSKLSPQSPRVPLTMSRLCSSHYPPLFV